MRWATSPLLTRWPLRRSRYRCIQILRLQTRRRLSVHWRTPSRRRDCRASNSEAASEGLPMKRGFLSDAHGNVEGFEAALSVLDRVGVDELYYLGDAVGYLPGAAVVGSLRRSGARAIMGNHEAM